MEESLLWTNLKIVFQVSKLVAAQAVCASYRKAHSTMVKRVQFFDKIITKDTYQVYTLTLNNPGFFGEFFGRNEVCLINFSFKES